MTILFFILIGFLGSLAGSYIGISGGAIFVPLILIVSNNYEWAKTISVFAVIVLSISSVVKYYMQKRRINFRLSFIIAIPAIISAVIATLYISPFVSKKLIYILYIILTCFISLLMIARNKYQLNIFPSSWSLIVIGIIFGLISGIFGIGGGVLYIPTLVILFNFNVKDSGPNALVITGLSAIAIFVTHGIKGDIESSKWYEMILVGVFAIPGSLLGTYINKKSSEKIIYFTFMLMMMAIICINVVKLIMI